MADILASAKGIIPKVSMSQVGSFFFWFMIFVLFAIIIGGAVAFWAYSYIQRKKFNKKLVIWQDVDGHPKIIARDVACENKIGGTGDTVFYAKKHKKILPRPNKQTGDNTYWYYIRADGTWINIGMQDIDMVMREAQVSWDDNELKYARASLQAINRDRFEKKPSFWDKWGNTIMNIAFIAIVSIALVFVTSKLAELVGTINAGQETWKLILDKMNILLSNMDKVCNPSGLVKVA